MIFLKIAQFHHIATKLAKTPQICKFVSSIRIDFVPKIVFLHKYARIYAFPSLVFTHTSKQILFLDFLRSQRKRADWEQFWPSPKKWLHSAKPMYGRYASRYSRVFDYTILMTSCNFSPWVPFFVHHKSKIYIFLKQKLNLTK